MTYYVWFIIFAVVAYFIATDDSIAAAFYYVTRIIKNKYLIFQWWLIHNPSTPWAKYSMWRHSNRLAKELMNELKSRNK